MPRDRLSHGVFVSCFAAIVLAGLFCATPSSRAANIVLVNLDGANEGFNDTTAAAPIGGNPGTTLGEQRLNVFKMAFAIWGAILPSSVETRVQGAFNSLPCTATSGILGGANVVATAHDFVGAPVANTEYPIALASKLAGTDLAPNGNDIQIQFNSDVDNQSCLGSVDWYYGLDNDEGSDVNLLSTALHELGHGLGFLTFTDEGSGGFMNGRPDIYSRFLYDRTQGLRWDEMTNAQRAASTINTGNLVWIGPSVTQNLPRFLLPAPAVRIDSPETIAGEKEFGTADFGPPLPEPPLQAEVVQAYDGSVPTGDGCQPIVNSAEVAGKIAIIDRGMCGFVQQVQNAQAAGAIAVIIVNNVTGRPPHMPGSDPSITIPAVSIADDDGFLIEDELSFGSTVVAALGTDPNHLAGTDPEGRLRMYAPSPIQPGSSLSHWDVTPWPNLLMEARYTADLGAGVDLTQYAFVDMGWWTGVSGVAVARGADAPHAYSAPNPFHRATSIRFETASSGKIDVEVFDVRGELVKRLPVTWRPAGRQSVKWDGTDSAGREAPAGVYFWRVSSQGKERTGRVVRVE